MGTSDGDFLKAKFRAFKFPQSPFVLFKGSVNVCLDSCLGVQCSNGQRGFGRRRLSAIYGKRSSSATVRRPPSLLSSTSLARPGLSTTSPLDLQSPTSLSSR